MIGVPIIVLGAAGMVLFLLPVLSGGIVNIGNVTGLCVSLAFLLYGAFREKIHTFLVYAWRQGGIPGRIVLSLAGAAGAGIVLTALVLTIMIVRSAMRRPAADADVIVLGCEVKGERPSLMLTGRMEAAIDWLNEHPDVKCVLSGGRGDNEMISEAECMYRYMTAHGIEPDRLLLEDRSVSTRENLLFSKSILEKEGRAPAEAAIVTSEIHECRAHMIAKKLGMKPGSVPAGTPWWLLPTFFVRELYGLLYQMLL